MTDLLYYASWAGAFFTGWVIPWWIWLPVGLALGGAAWFLLVPYVPSSIRQFLAYGVMAAFACLSLYSLGNANGIALENERWERLMAAERTRLEEGFKEQLGAEQARAQLAANALEQMRDTVEEITNAADKVAGGDDTCVPEPIARSLRSLRPNYTKRDHR
jgi:hypothetical protein